MAPRVTRRTVAEIDREFDELTSALSDPREQLITSGERTSRLRPRASQADNTSDHLDSDEAMDENIQINAAAHNTEDPAKKSGRKVTTNDQLRKRRAKENNIDIKFPKDFAKVIIAFNGCLLHYIIVVQQKFPELSEEVKDCAMRQVESQYNNRRYRLLQAYHNKKPRPQHVSPEDLETGEWLTAIQVWRATYEKADGTWSIPTGEEIMTKLQEAAGIHQEKISSAPVSIVEHFALVLGRKPNHSCGVGIRSVNRVAKERIRLQAQIEASEQREAAAQARADAAEQRAETADQQAQALEDQVSTVVETNAHLQEEQQSQRDELTPLRQAQSGEVVRLVREQLDNQLAELIARIHSGAS
ncbi:unnamed protein product [Miscanthus lutarioriparius]|uniref:Uncharacterized protein n=1 Tax=Miscanthus lutarioriparius TaxID=422564 RepID=A0A811Q1F6_9POAL|nr:unnamed protein product [Miscanthus lutarioriparius]